jgi:hypothetical protein
MHQHCITLLIYFIVGHAGALHHITHIKKINAEYCITLIQQCDVMCDNLGAFPISLVCITKKQNALPLASVSI